MRRRRRGGWRACGGCSPTRSAGPSTRPAPHGTPTAASVRPAAPPAAAPACAAAALSAGGDTVWAGPDRGTRFGPGLIEGHGLARAGHARRADLRLPRLPPARRGSCLSVARRRWRASASLGVAPARAKWNATHTHTHIARHTHTSRDTHTSRAPARRPYLRHCSPAPPPGPAASAQPAGRLSGGPDRAFRP